MKNEFCTYEQSLAIKELGFDEQYIASYSSDGKLYSNEVWNYRDGIKAPLISQAFRFFREKYGLNSSIRCVEKSVTKYWFEVSGAIVSLLTFDTYEEAEQSCLDKLIKLAKEK